MKKDYLILLGIIGTILIAIIVRVGVQWTSPKIAFVSHQQLFEGYQGRIDVAQILNQQQKNQQQKQDSMLRMTQIDSLRGQQLQRYQQQQSQLQQKAEQYTTQIWKQINKGVQIYGQQNGYQFIFGGRGDGTLMYADSTQNITPKVLEFLNQRYQKNDIH